MSIASKLLGLVVMGVIAATTFAAPTVAMAGPTALCKVDEDPCEAGNSITHVHEESLGHAVLLSLIDVECEALFLGDMLESSGEPLVIKGKFTYTCLDECTAVESGSALILVLRTGHELAVVTGHGLVRVECGSIKCNYDGTGLQGHALGPLLSSMTNGSVELHEQQVNEEAPKSIFCPNTGSLDILTEPLEKLHIVKNSEAPPHHQHKTALCTTDDTVPTCLEEHKPSTVDFKDSAVEFLTSLLNSKCEGLISGTVGGVGEPQEVKVESKYTSCSNSCTITEISGGSKLFFLLEGELSDELAAVTTEGLELFLKCGSTVKCAFGPMKLTGDALGALATKDNGHIAFSKAPLGEGEGLLCPTEASIDALFVASSETYIREDYAKPPTSLCSKDEGSPVCKSENQLKSIDYKDKAVEILTNLINVKCEGLASGTVGSPGNPLEVKAELTYSSCSGGCFVTAVSGPGKIMLQREGKAEEASATSEGFEIFVKCGTTIKCLLGPEKMAGKALGALTTGDNGHLTFTKVSMGKGEGATCPSEATVDALYVASSAAYIG